METLTVVRFVVRDDGTVESVSIDRLERDAERKLHRPADMSFLIWNPEPQQAK